MYRKFEKEWEAKWVKFLKNNQKENLDMDGYTVNENTTWEMISSKDNDDIIWSMRYVSLNPNITPSVVESNPQFPWTHWQLSSNRNFKWEYIVSRPEWFLPPKYTMKLGENPNVTWEIIQSNPQIEWDMDSVSENPSITWDVVTKNPEYEWSYSGLCSNPNITWDIVSQRLWRKWDYWRLGRNPNITSDIVLKNRDKPWRHTSLCQNPNVDWSVIETLVRESISTEDIPDGILYYYKSLYCGTTFEEVERSKDEPWFFQVLSRNNFRRAKEDYMRRRYREEFMKEEGLAWELMSVVWHPRNFHKFKYLDPEMFAEW